MNEICGIIQLYEDASYFHELHNKYPIKRAKLETKRMMLKI